jgi:hypothetical protein
MKQIYQTGKGEIVILFVNTKTLRINHFLNATLIAFLLLLILAGLAAAQSTDSSSPAPMTTGQIQGILLKGKPIVHYDSFMSGPGIVTVAFEFTGRLAQNVGGQLTDAFGQAFTELNREQEDPYKENKSLIGLLYQPQLVLIGRFSVPRRQKLVVKIYTAYLDTDDEVKYKIRVVGGNVSFVNESDSGFNSAPSKSQAEYVRTTQLIETSTVGITKRTAPGRIVTDKCKQEYMECIRKYNGISACIVARSMYLKRSKKSSEFAESVFRKKLKSINFQAKMRAWNTTLIGVPSYRFD